MNPDYRIEIVEDPEESAWGIIGGGLHEYNRQQAGDNKFQRLCFAVLTPEQDVAGGVLGELYWGWLHVDLLWIKEELRGQGYGRRLLETVEEAGRQRGAKYAFLDTFSFQAPEFYKRYGYTVFGELPEFPAGHQRFFFMKPL